MPFKTVITIAGVVTLGVVGYKIAKKQNPKLVKKVKKSINSISDEVVDMLEEAKDSFSTGYKSA